jgi:PGF-pre-PGF domain-containing protein
MIFVVSVNADDGSLAMNVDYLKESYEQQKETEAPKEEDTTTNTIESSTIDSDTIDTTTIDTITDTEETSTKETTTPQKITISTDNEKIESSTYNNEINEVEEIEEDISQNDSSQGLYEVEDSFFQKADEIIIKKDLGDITTGVTVNVESDKEEISIKSLEFETTGNYENVNYTIKKLDDKSADILEEPMDNCTVYVYLDIKLTTNEIYMHEEEFEYIKFQFKVNKSWIKNNNIDLESITLVRFNNGWHPLPTLFFYEDEHFIYFEAESPGLSIYTVVGTEIVEGSHDLVINKPAIPLNGWFAIISFISITLVAVIYKLKLVYSED